MDIAKYKIFGPVMNILKFNDFSEVVERANNTFYGLAAAFWTKDIQKARCGSTATTSLMLLRRLEDCKMSGIGKELGEAALANYTELKTVTVNLGS